MDVFPTQGMNDLLYHPVRDKEIEEFQPVYSLYIYRLTLSVHSSLMFVFYLLSNFVVLVFSCIAISDYIHREQFKNKK